MDDEIKPQSAISAALEQLTICETTDELVRAAAKLSEMFHDNQEVIEYLYEQSLLVLDRLTTKRPTMTSEMFRKLMGNKVADA